MAFAAVTDEFLALFEGHRESVRVGERGRGVRRLDPVVLALGAVRVAREAAALAQVLEAVASTGEQFVDVGLVSGVPEQDVLGGLEDPVQRQRQFDDAEVGPEVTAGGSCHGRDDELADLAAELVELVVGERLEVGGRFNRRQNHRPSLVLALTTLFGMARSSAFRVLAHPDEVNVRHIIRVGTWHQPFKA